MAPLGIITAVVSAIRVGGPSWLKAVIGRARENRASAEIELMTSTSHEVCELWNGQGIVRILGKPQMSQIIFLESRKDDETFGLFTLRSQGIAAHELMDEKRMLLLFDRLMARVRKRLKIAQLTKLTLLPMENRSWLD